jgi:hypothetical protein
VRGAEIKDGGSLGEIWLEMTSLRFKHSLDCLSRVEPVDLFWEKVGSRAAV